jgi:hypothetical protein
LFPSFFFFKNFFSNRYHFCLAKGGTGKDTIDVRSI